MSLTPRRLACTVSKPKDSIRYNALQKKQRGMEDLMIRQILDPLTRYPMHLNIAGAIHRSLTAETLHLKAQRNDQLSQVAHTRWQTFSGTYYKTMSSICAAGASSLSPLGTTADWLFGTMSADPAANPYAIRRGTGLVGLAMALVATNTTYIVSGKSLAAGCVAALAVGAVYRSDGWKVAADRGIAVVSMPVLFVCSQLISLAGALLKAALLAPYCVLGIIAGISMAAYTALRWQSDGYALSGALRNDTDFAQLEPVANISSHLLFVTEDQYAFNVADLVKYNQNREILTNPYTLEPLSAHSRRRLLRHKSGLGIKLINLEIGRTDAARALSSELIERAHELAEATQLRADPILKEVAIVQFIDYIDSLPKKDRDLFYLAFTSGSGETFPSWRNDLNNVIGATLNRNLFGNGEANSSSFYDLINMMPCTEGFSAYMRRCVDFVRRSQAQAAQ